MPRFTRKPNRSSDDEMAMNMAKKQAFQLDAEIMTKITDEVRKKILDELAPKIKTQDYTHGSFMKLHFNDIEALRSRIDRVEREDGGTPVNPKEFGPSSPSRVDDIEKKLEKLILENVSVRKLEGEIMVLKDMIKRLTTDPSKLMRLAIDNFTLEEKETTEQTGSNIGSLIN